MKVVELAEAAALVPPDSTVAISGGGYRVAPEGLLEAVEHRFLTTGSPSGLTVITVAMIERSRGGRGGAGTGLNRLAHPGLMTTLVTSSFSRTIDQELSRAIRNDDIATVNLPMGTVVQWLRAVGAGHDGMLTRVGLGTFVDPRIEGGRVNPSAPEPWSSVVELTGREYLFYPTRAVDVALIKGSAADDRGNVFLDREAYDHGIFHTALAAKNSGGTVIAVVNRLVPRGAIHPRFGSIPGSFVDVVCVDERVWEDEQEPTLIGSVAGTDVHVVADRPLRPRDVIARRAVLEFGPDVAVNLGAGIPMYDIPPAARSLGRHDVQFAVEQGPVGGTPGMGGVSVGPELILESLSMFDLLEGGGADVACLAFGEIDTAGNVNVSRLGDLRPGCGGFPNIAHGTRKLIMCGTLTAGGLNEQVTDGRIRIETEGRIRRFVPEVQQITYNGAQGDEDGTDVMVITERGVFNRRNGRLVLTEIAPGIDLDRDIRAHIDFGFDVADTLRPMPAECLAAAAPDVATSGH